MQFFCPYCKLWISDLVHVQHYHNDLDEPDDRRDDRVRVDGVIYEDEEEYLVAIKDPHTLSALLNIAAKTGGDE